MQESGEFVGQGLLTQYGTDRAASGMANLTKGTGLEGRMGELRVADEEHIMRLVGGELAGQGAAERAEQMKKYAAGAMAKQKASEMEFMGKAQSGGVEDDVLAFTQGTSKRFGLSAGMQVQAQREKYRAAQGREREADDAIAGAKEEGLHIKEDYSKKYEAQRQQEAAMAEEVNIRKRASNIEGGIVGMKLAGAGLVDIDPKDKERFDAADKILADQKSARAELSNEAKLFSSDLAASNEGGGHRKEQGGEFYNRLLARQLGAKDEDFGDAKGVRNFLASKGVEEQWHGKGTSTKTRTMFHAGGQLAAGEGKAGGTYSDATSPELKAAYQAVAELKRRAGLSGGYGGGVGEFIGLGEGGDDEFNAQQMVQQMESSKGYEQIKAGETRKEGLAAYNKARIEAGVVSDADVAIAELEANDPGKSLATARERLASAQKTMAPRSEGGYADMYGSMYGVGREYEDMKEWEMKSMRESGRLDTSSGGKYYGMSEKEAFEAQRDEKALKQQQDLASAREKVTKLEKEQATKQAKVSQLKTLSAVGKKYGVGAAMSAKDYQDASKSGTAAFQQFALTTPEKIEQRRSELMGKAQELEGRSGTNVEQYRNRKAAEKLRARAGGLGTEKGVAAENQIMASEAMQRFGAMSDKQRAAAVAGGDAQAQYAASRTQMAASGAQYRGQINPQTAQGMAQAAMAGRKDVRYGRLLGGMGGTEQFDEAVTSTYGAEASQAFATRREMLRTGKNTVTGQALSERDLQNVRGAQAKQAEAMYTMGGEGGRGQQFNEALRIAIVEGMRQAKAEEKPETEQEAAQSAEAAQNETQEAAVADAKNPLAEIVDYFKGLLGGGKDGEGEGPVITTESNVSANHNVAGTITHTGEVSFKADEKLEVAVRKYVQDMVAKGLLRINDNGALVSSVPPEPATTTPPKKT
jgi:hypothetical protein